MDEIISSWLKFSVPACLHAAVGGKEDQQAVGHQAGKVDDGQAQLIPAAARVAGR